MLSLVLLISMGCCRTLCLLPAPVQSDQLIPHALPDLGITDPILPEDAKLNFTELVKKNGYPVEEHTVVSDGYELTIFRITGKGKCNGTSGCAPVLMIHGLADSANTWVLAGTESGPAYALANAGYDVWCGSVRGDTYGRKHQSLDPDHDAPFWDFSFDEYARDVMNSIHYILAATKKDCVFYVGHSQGTSDFFVMTSSIPESNSIICKAMLLAPVAYLTHIQSKIVKMVLVGSPVVRAAFKATGTEVGEILGSKQPSHHLTDVLCTLVPETVCNIAILAVAGDRPGSIARDTLQLIPGHSPGGTSLKNLAHFGQVITSGRYANYDYGHKQNMKVYGSSQPPKYDLSKVSAPVVLISGRADKLSTTKDVQRLKAELPNIAENYTVPDPTWGHQDSIWGKQTPKYIINKMVEHFEMYCDQNCDYDD